MVPMVPLDLAPTQVMDPDPVCTKLYHLNGTLVCINSHGVARASTYTCFGLRPGSHNTRHLHGALVWSFFIEFNNSSPNHT
ncbi:hypothetical protein FCV25MIE_13291 [Fagus crenata]